MANRPYSQLLAEFVSDFDPNAIPAPVLERTRQSVLNCIAAALSASTHQTISRLVKIAVQHGGHGSSALFGRSESVGLLDAALINGYMAHFNDYDDTHRETVYHTNAPVVPPVLGLAAEKRLSGKEVLHSLALGLEASMRLGQGLGHQHYDIGWHATGTVGTAGAALACARLLKLDARHTNYALGFALTQASGLRGQMFGTAAKALNAGTAAMNGLLSALLADQGLDAAEDSIEGDMAYASAAAPKPNLERITEGIGVSWVVPDIAFKPYASGAATHAGIDAALDLRRQVGLGPGSTVAEVDRAIEGLEEVVLTIPGRMLHLPRGREISAGLQAKFSIYNAVALAFVKGSAGPRDFSDAITTDPRIKAFRELIKLVGDEHLPRNSASIQARLRHGSSPSCHVEHGSGSPDKPMSDADIRAKLFDAGRDLMDSASLERLATVAEHLDQVEDVGTLVGLTVPPGAR